MTEGALTKDSVLQFLNRFEEIAEKENFDLLQNMIHDNAVFRFNDGDFVGKQAVRSAFEKTWKGSTNVKKERFYLTDIQVLTVDGRVPLPRTPITGKGRWTGSPSAFKVEERECSSLRMGGCRSSMNTLARIQSSDT